MNNENSDSNKGKISIIVALITLVGTIVAASITGGSTIFSQLIENIIENNKVANSLPTPDKTSTPIPDKTPPTLDKYLYDCTEESKKFDENQCKKVLQTLEHKFSKIDVNDISWDFIRPIYNCDNVEELIEARFKIDNETVNAEFTSEGILMEIEYEGIPIAQLPEHIKMALDKYLTKNRYEKPGFYELEIDPNTGKKWYEFEVDKRQDKDITFDENGNKIEERENKCED